MTTTKPKRKRSTKPKKANPSYVPVSQEEPSFYAKAIGVRGRFTLSWMLFCAAVRILIKGRALV